MRRSYGGRHFFVNKFGGPVSSRGLAQTFAALHPQFLRFKNLVARPHSARLSGARMWLRLGASLDTTATIGCWSDIRTLKYYAGSEVLALRLQAEMSRHGESRQASQLSEALQKLLVKFENFPEPGYRPEAWGTLQGLPEPGYRPEAWGTQGAVTASKPMAADALVIAMLRRPKRWHRIKFLEGPIWAWQTQCGCRFNADSMTIMPSSALDHAQPSCDSCQRA